MGDPLPTGDGDRQAIVEAVGLADGEEASVLFVGRNAADVVVEVRCRHSTGIVLLCSRFSRGRDIVVLYSCSKQVAVLGNAATSDLLNVRRCLERSRE